MIPTQQLRSLRNNLISQLDNRVGTYDITDNIALTLNVFFNLKLNKVKINTGYNRIISNVERLNSEQLYTIECELNDYLNNKL